VVQICTTQKSVVQICTTHKFVLQRQTFQGELCRCGVEQTSTVQNGRMSGHIHISGGVVQICRTDFCVVQICTTPRLVLQRQTFQGELRRRGGEQRGTVQNTRMSGPICMSGGVVQTGTTQQLGPQRQTVQVDWGRGGVDQRGATWKCTNEWSHTHVRGICTDRATSGNRGAQHKSELRRSVQLKHELCRSAQLKNESGRSAKLKQFSEVTSHV